MPNESPAAILKVTCRQAEEYLRLFVNRRAHIRQSHFPHKETGRYYYYQARDLNSKQAAGIDLSTIQSHLAGHITIGLYAINPQSQASKWFAIDADYDDSQKDLLRIQKELHTDGIEALMEQSRRGGHLWAFHAEPLPARLCRIYVLHVANRLGIEVKRGKLDGIEVFPRQCELEPGDYGSAIRGPLGIHRASMQRFWFDSAEPNLDAQFRLLRQAKRVSREQLETLTAGIAPILDGNSKVIANRDPTFKGVNNAFEILLHVPSAKPIGRNYVARCPACASRGEDRRGTHLAISVAEPRMYHCWAGCTAEQIREALGVPIRRQWAA
jgi:hypothetical protein